MEERSTPIALPAGEGELVGTSVVKAARPELSLIEFEIKPGGGVQPHFHKGHSDSFSILEGEVEFYVGDEVVHASPGSFSLSIPAELSLTPRSSSSTTSSTSTDTCRKIESARADFDRAKIPEGDCFRRHSVTVRP